MQLRTLAQLNFRNLSTERLAFEPGLTVVVGGNGAGKSNLLAACHLVLSAELPFGRIADAIRHGEEAAYVAGRFEHEDGESQVEIGLRPGRRSVQLDGNPVRSEQLATSAAVVMMTPADTEIVHGSPSRRRAWLDSLLGRLSLRYAKLTTEYSRVLTQRNSMLRQGWFDASLDTWSERLVVVGVEIEQLRARAIARIRQIASEAYSEVAAADESRLLGLALQSADRVPLGEALEQSRAEERARGVTVVGPHRDDLVLTLNGRSVQAFGSRGEARTVALALKVAEFQLLLARHGEEPVLLLDDFTAELDPHRRSYLLDLASKTRQTIATGTEPPADTHGARLLHISGGIVGHG